MTDIQSDLPDGWVWTTLGETCVLIMGQSPPSNTYNNKGIGLPFFQGKAEFGDLYPTPVKWCTEPKKTAEPNDVLISIRAPVGPTNLTKVVSCIGRGLAALRPELEMSERYFLYYLRSIEQDWSEYSTGTTFEAISGNRLASRSIPLAPLNEQRRIVDAVESYFTRLDAAEAALRRAQAKLAQYKTALLKAACEGRLVPTEAELARQEGRDYEPAEVLLARVLKERRAKWEAEHPGKKYQEPIAPNVRELPELPEGWCWTSVKMVGKVQLGRQRAPQHHTGPYLRPYLRVANVYEDRIDLSDILEMNFSPEEYERYRLNDGDILLNEGQSPEFLGRPAMFRNEIPGICFQNTLIRFQAYEPLNRSYTLILFRNYMRQGRFRQESQITTNIAHLSAGRFAEIEFALPPLAEQERIVAEVERRLSLVDALETALAANLTRAARLRQAILRRAFAGQLVPQDANDEPAAVLWERIRECRGAPLRSPMSRRGS